MNPAQNNLVRHALLVERIDGPLNELAPSLRAFGYQVTRASDGGAIDGYVRSLKRLSLAIVNADTLKTDSGQLIASIRELHPELPVVWFASEVRHAKPPGEKLDLFSDVQQIENWLVQRARGELYAPDFVQKLLTVSQQVLEQFALPTTPSPPRLTRGICSLSEVNAFVFLSGEKLGGYLVLGSSVADLSLAVHSQFSRRVPAADEFEDLLGEAANQIMGQLKNSLAGGECRVGLPCFVRGSGALFRHKSGSPALAVAFAKREQKLCLELSFHRFDGAPLRLESVAPEREPGSLQFL
jgi:CheY-specific phosphatase CheX